ncbi:MAG TPA: DUF1587 domain-containing protein, partial [Polyangiales bacterium]|nr:DUF1587 domain-containing protein [Polyangiales bacterium]
MRVSQQRGVYLAAVSCVFALLACTGEIGAPSRAKSQARADAGVDTTTVPGEAGQGSPSDPPAADGGGGALALDCDGPNSTITPLQRLTRRQYQNSVSDLFAVSFDSSAIAEDEKVGAFSANTVAPVSELSVEQYMEAAESVAKSAMAKLPSLVSCD